MIYGFFKIKCTYPPPYWSPKTEWTTYELSTTIILPKIILKTFYHLNTPLCIECFRRSFSRVPTVNPDNSFFFFFFWSFLATTGAHSCIHKDKNPFSYFRDLFIRTRFFRIHVHWLPNTPRWQRPTVRRIARSCCVHSYYTTRPISCKEL